MGKKTAVLEEPQAEAADVIAVELFPAPPRGGYVANRIDVSRLTYSQRVGLHLLVSSLDKVGATLSDGRRVVTAVDATRWVFERIAEQREEGWKPDGY